jgi:hypothetical protein
MKFQTKFDFTKDVNTKLVLIEAIGEDKMKLTQYQGRKSGIVSELDISEVEDMIATKVLIESFRVEEVK